VVNQKRPRFVAPVGRFPQDLPFGGDQQSCYDCGQKTPVVDGGLPGDYSIAK
jgi:hypothetical protein